MPDPPIIRPATTADAARLAELCGVLGYPVAVEEFAPRLAHMLGRPEDVILVAELGKAGIVGWIHAGERYLLEYGRRGEILGLVVAGTHRGAGVGRALVAAAEAWAREQGLTEVAVRSNVTRRESHPFYEHLGYTRTKTQHSYRKGIEGA